jgi:hypothetical protein
MGANIIALSFLFFFFLGKRAEIAAGKRKVTDSESGGSKLASNVISRSRKRHGGIQIVEGGRQG